MFSTKKVGRFFKNSIDREKRKIHRLSPELRLWEKEKAEGKEIDFSGDIPSTEDDTLILEKPEKETPQEEPQQLQVVRF